MQRIPTMLMLVLLATGLSGCESQPPIESQGVGMRGMLDMTKVPKGYDTYTLFLATSHDYTGLLKTAVIKQALSERFESFGDAIGARNLAIFVSNPQTGNLDVSAGKTMLHRVNTGYGTDFKDTDGPFIVVLQSHPNDPPKPGEEAAVIALHSKDPAAINEMIDEIQSEITSVKAKPQLPEESTFAGFWRSVRDGWAAVGASPAHGIATIMVSSGTN
jgi:hypothetical protein